MTVWWLVLIGSSLVAVVGVVAALLMHSKKRIAGDASSQAIYEKTATEIEKVFTDEFREELRNHGRLHFEKIIGENAMFLQQDLRLTTSELNEFMKQEISKKLQDEFNSYEQSMRDAQEMAVNAIRQTVTAVDTQRAEMAAAFEQALQQEKEAIMQRFENNMGEVINHYLTEAIGNQIDLRDQMQYILGEMEANKEAIRKDMYS